MVPQPPGEPLSHPGQVRGLAPEAGEQTRTLLEIGPGWEEIAKLKAVGAI